MESSKKQQKYITKPRNIFTVLMNEGVKKQNKKPRGNKQRKSKSKAKHLKIKAQYIKSK